MYASLVLLLGITSLYAGYNLLVKVSSGHVPAAATTPILATIALQTAALAVSAVYAAGLVLRGGHVLAVSRPPSPGRWRRGFASGRPRSATSTSSAGSEARTRWPRTSRSRSS